MIKDIKPSRFNNHSKSKDFFPIKQYRFDTTKHPIIQSRKELKFRVKTILSVQENQQLTGLVNSLQCNQRDAIRIAFYEALRRGTESLQTVLKYATRDSKERGHTARSHRLLISLPNSEKQALLEIGKELDLSEMEVVRLAIIWLAYGIKHETITRIHKCQRIAIDALADKWSRENRGKPPNPRVKKLKEGRDEQKEIKILLNDGVSVTTANSALDDIWGMLMYGKEEERYEGYANKLGKSLKNINGWERQILGIMLFYSFNYKQAVDIYYEDKQEADRIITMNRSEFLQHLKDQQYEDSKYRKMSKETEEKEKKKKTDPDYQLYFQNSQKLAHIEDEEIIADFFNSKSDRRNKENLETNLLMLESIRENFNLLTQTEEELEENELPLEDLL